MAIKSLSATITRKTGLIASLLLTCVAACATNESHRSLDRLHPCLSSEGPTDALCGTVTVPENRHTGIGRQIRLWVVVLPSLASTANAHPLFLLAGGPDQAAAQLASQIRNKAVESVQTIFSMQV